MPYRTAWVWLAVGVLALAAAACGPGGNRQRRSERREVREADAAPYEADIEEGLGAAVAILVDTSGSMRERVEGDSRPKHVVAREALEAMLDATDAFVAKRPDFPIKIGIYRFSSRAGRVCPIQRYDRAAFAAACADVTPPGGGHGSRA